MLNLGIFDNRYIPEIDRNPRAFFPPYIGEDSFQKQRYLTRREVNKEKNPFHTELILFEVGENLLSN